MRSVEYRERIYGILTDPETPVETRIHRTLEVGAEYLDLPVGFFTRIDGGVQEIVHSVGDHALLQPGETCPLDDAYCRRTVEIESPLAVQDIGASSAVAESAVDRFGLGTYIGARITVQNEAYGTICFADTETRTKPFSDVEQYFVELAARLAGQALEQRAYEREIAEHKEDIRTKEEVYRAVVDACFDVVVQVGPEDTFTYVSPDIEELLGYTPGECLGKPFTAMLPDQETIETAQDIYETVMSGQTVVREYFPLEHKSGEQVLVDIQIAPRYATDVQPDERSPPDIVGLQGMFRDARGRHRRQRMIRILNRVLRHNLRNDMTVVRGHGEVLQDRLDSEEATYAGRIVNTADRLLSLSETARQLERNFDTPPEIHTGDIVPVVTQTAAKVDSEYPDATVTVDAPESAMCQSAPRLENAVYELLDNAATHAGNEPSIDVVVWEADDSTAIRIEDDGPGLPENERAILVSGDETPLKHGRGLGLWLVYWVVETLDGQIKLHKNEDGTCIEIWLKRTGDV